MKGFQEQESLKQFLVETFPLVEKNKDYLIFDLKRKIK